MAGTDEVVRRFFEGDRWALSRLISWAENGDPRYPPASSRIHPRTGKSWRVGITGPPGVGKSTLTNELVVSMRAAGQTVGVLAIDPSSPFSGGALLGDRIRMEERTADGGVYIRSMASRDSHGGLARAAVDACDVMDAFGFDRVLVETVGVGQSEYDVVAAADTVVVVMAPGLGDGIQAMKAGILEVADVLVVNKADLPGAEQVALHLEDAVRMRDIRREGHEAEWTVPVVLCSAAPALGAAPGGAPGTSGTPRASGPGGIDAVLEAVAAHRRHLEAGDLEAVRLRKRVEQVRRVVRERLEEELWEGTELSGRVESSLRGTATPYDVALGIVRSVLDSLPADEPGAPTAR